MTMVIIQIGKVKLSRWETWRLKTRQCSRLEDQTKNRSLASIDDVHHVIEVNKVWETKLSMTRYKKQRSLVDIVPARMHSSQITSPLPLPKKFYNILTILASPQIHPSAVHLDVCASNTRGSSKSTVGQDGALLEIDDRSASHANGSTALNC